MKKIVIIIMVTMFLVSGCKRVLPETSSDVINSVSTDNNIDVITDSTQFSNTVTETVSNESSSKPLILDSSIPSKSTTSAVSKPESLTIIQSEREKKVEVIMKQTILNTNGYSIETYLNPYWKNNIIYNESVFPLQKKDGSFDAIELMCYADKILEIRSPDLKIVYIYGKDYTLENGKLIIPNGSAIPPCSIDRFYLDEEIIGKSFSRVGGGWVLFSEGAYFHNRQIVVTYIHTDDWNGPIPVSQGSKLPKLLNILKNKGNLNIVYYGDSITQGANSSGAIGVAPFAPKWADMFTSYLETNYGVKVTAFNPSEGGQISSWALENVKTKVIDANPDLVVIAFGMNDGTHKVSAETFKYNIKTTVEKIKVAKPNCEIILISSMLPNSDIVGFFGTQLEFVPVLKEIANEVNGVAVANVTELHQFMSSHKRYCDITGNNVNHPNDFVARLYAQVLIKTIQ